MPINLLISKAKKCKIKYVLRDGRKKNRKIISSNKHVRTGNCNGNANTYRKLPYFWWAYACKTCIQRTREEMVTQSRIGTTTRRRRSGQVNGGTPQKSKEAQATGRAAAAEHSPVRPWRPRAKRTGARGGAAVPLLQCSSLQPAAPRAGWLLVRRGAARLVWGSELHPSAGAGWLHVGRRQVEAPWCPSGLSDRPV